jgi:hypothetical protein
VILAICTATASSNPHLPKPTSPGSNKQTELIVQVFLPYGKDARQLLHHPFSAVCRPSSELTVIPSLPRSHAAI